jgi:hypothetical protein
MYRDLLGRRGCDELDTLLDVIRKASVASLEKLLLLLVCAADDVNRLLGAVGLQEVSVRAVKVVQNSPLTPSSMGTEKKSVPVVLAMASPPVTPGR